MAFIPVNLNYGNRKCFKDPKSSIPNNKRKKDPREQEIKQSKKEILRKDKALAEDSALLISKTKTNLLWGVADSELD